MKRITEYRKLFGLSKDADLSELKVIYRNLMKECHPDKFHDGDPAKLDAEIKSKIIIEANHFLVSISAETHSRNIAEYTNTITTSGIDDFTYKGQLLKVIFFDGSAYEYFGVPKGVYNKLVNSPTPIRFARRHIFESFTYRKVAKAKEEHGKQ
jgi:curved DNA-binding protein CbpA